MNAKHLSYCLLLLISAGFLTQCYLKPEFDTRPEIKFESIRSIQLTENGLTRDSIIIAIEFQDGDGDLGLSATDTNPPFQELNADGTLNEFFFNYFVRMFRRQNGQYVEFIFPDPNFTLNGRFPVLNVEGKKGPLQGTLFRNVVISSLYPFRNDTVRFEIQIADRALQKSNVIVTDSVVINIR